MKPTYFSRVFKQATGRNFIEFVNRLRISKSCELLADGDKPVTEVCLSRGSTIFPTSIGAFSSSRA
jgi:AraC-like DNA-binding protein